jgi:hypothetical protein
MGSYFILISANVCDIEIINTYYNIFEKYNYI